MADNTQLSTNVGTGDTIRTLEDGSSIKWPAGVTAYATTVGTPDVLQIVTPTAGLPIQIQTGSSIPVTDNSGSLTVDAPVGTPVFVRLSDGSAAITALPVTDNGGSLTVDGTVAATQSGTWTSNVQGTQAKGASLTANPVPIGGWAGDTPEVQVTDGKHVYAWFTRSGALNIADGGDSLTVDNAGTFAVQAAQSGTWNVTNISGTVSLPTGAATAAKQPALGTAGTASSDVLTVQGIASMTALKVDGTGGSFPVTDSGGSLTVDNGGTFAVQATIAAAATNIAKAEDAASADADVGVPAMAVRKATPANTSGTDGDYEMLQMSAGRLWASATIDTALPAGTNAIGKLASNTGVTIGAVEIAASQTLATVTTVSTVTTCSTLTGSGVAHDGVDSGNPHKIGAKATTSVAGLTLVANADRTDLFAGVDGVQIVRADCNLEDILQDRATNTDGASTAFAGGLAAPGAGVRIYVKKVTICNTSASMVTVDLRDGAAGSVLWTLPVPATGGVVENFNPPLKLTANTALAYDASAATTTLTISANGFKSKV